MHYEPTETMIGWRAERCGIISSSVVVRELTYESARETQFRLHDGDFQILALISIRYACYEKELLLLDVSLTIKERWVGRGQIRGGSREGFRV